NRLSSNSNAGKLQAKLNAEISKHFTKNRGKKKANFHVCRESRMPAVLTENGFIDNKTDANILKKESNLKKIGQAHAIGIAKYFGLKKKKKGGLTVSEAKKLQEQINELKDALNKKEKKQIETESTRRHETKKKEGY